MNSKWVFHIGYATIALIMPGHPSEMISLTAFGSSSLLTIEEDFEIDIFYYFKV